MYLVVTLLAEHSLVENVVKKVRPFKLKFVVFERQSEQDAGVRNAFQANCDATVNTTVTSQPKIKNLGNVSSRHKEIVTVATDQATCVKQVLSRGHSLHLEELNV